MCVKLADGTVRRFRDLKQGWAGAAWDSEAARQKRERQLEGQATDDTRDIDPDSIDLEEAWGQIVDLDESVNYSTLRVIVSKVTTDVDRALEVLQERGKIVTEQGSGFALAPQ